MKNHHSPLIRKINDFFKSIHSGAYHVPSVRIVPIVFILTSSSIFGEIIFKDNFKNELYTRLEWIASNQSESAMLFTDNGVTLSNNHTYNSMILLHSLPVKPVDFSMSVTIVQGSAGSGIFFNVNRDNNGGYNGYAAVVSFGKAEVIKFSKGSIATIASFSSPFIKPTNNTLTISKNKESISLFCNGYFLYTVKDGELPAGDCALMIQPSSRALFSQVEINSQCLDSLRFPIFYDDFSSSTSFGWRKNGNGLIVISDSLLKIATGALQQCSFGVDFPIKNFKLRTIILWDTGSDTSLYGLYIKPKCAGSEPQQPGTFKYGINKKGDLKLVNASDSTVFHNQRPDYTLSKSMERLHWDTLELVQDNATIIWYLNSAAVLQTPAFSVIGSVGVFCSPGLDISFDNFELKNTDIMTSTTTRKGFAHSTQITKPAQPAVWFDILGRSFRMSSGNLPKGISRIVVSGSEKRDLTIH